MRILSQDGTFDVPYEMVVIQQHEERIYFLNKNLCGIGALGDLKLAEYSTAEKAQKAMEILRSVYYESELARIFHDETTYLTTHFQFPADNEV